MYFIEGQIRKICDVLHERMEQTLCNIENVDIVECGYVNPIVPPENADWKRLEKNRCINGRDAHFWLHMQFETPKRQENKEIYFDLKTGKEGQWDATNPQGFVFLNGKAVQGLDTNHTDVMLEYETAYDVYIYMYTGPASVSFELKASLKYVDTKIKNLYYDIFVPFSAALLFDKNEANYIEPIKAIELSLRSLDMSGDGFYESIDETQRALKENYYDKLCGKGGAGTAYCIGHTHIDVAWQWTLEQTREKAQRSFASMLTLMQRYPEFKFMSSQPQLYYFVKNAAPELYEQIKEAVRAGRWEPEGAMWLEADCNLTSGESLVRQILFGKRFFKEEFGVENKILWLPDVFGYSAALPQILKKCGVETFITSKISWNESNNIPYDSFMWEGIDGSEIFTWFITTRDAKNSNKNDFMTQNEYITSYNGMMNPSETLGSMQRYQQKEYNDAVIIAYGFGDGGGGTTAEMLEQQRRLACGLPGIPETKPAFVGEALETIKKNFFENAEKLGRMPRWVGELYLELHRGTYTSIAKNKKHNRLSELLYQKLETLCCTNMLLQKAEYPQKKINDAWQCILLNQFHDIIPGSSIFEVYEECDRQYNAILSEGTEMFENGLALIAENINTNGGLLVYNPNGFEASGMITDGGKCVYVENIPPMGYKIAEPKTPDGSISVSKKAVENKFFRMQLDENGNIVSLFDKRCGREIVKNNENFGELQVFEDLPYNYDAWEVSRYYKFKMKAVDKAEKIETVNEGARAGVRITRRFMQSEIVQTVYMYENIARIDFDTEIDWHQEHMLLKAAFPVDVHANEATYDIQFGHLKRPTHSNTSWDSAKFEVCGQKWADISEEGYGVSILNNCKYGHNAEGSTIKLSLLKCATFPNPEADKGLHRFTYSVYPHIGSFKEAGTVKEAYMLNNPLTGMRTEKHEGALKEEFSLVSCSSENIIIETVKKAETGNDIIVRFYEAFDKRCTAELEFGFNIKSAYICDMTENNIAPAEAVGNKVTLPVKNFEIVTLKITPEDIC